MMHCCRIPGGLDNAAVDRIKRPVLKVYGRKWAMVVVVAE
jgi:hypothetical protein